MCVISHPVTTVQSPVDISLWCVLSAILSQLFHLLLISVCDVCYQPSCYNCSISCWCQSEMCVISHPVTTVPSPVAISLCCVLSAILSQLFHLLLISVCAVCYQPSCHNCSISCCYQSVLCVISHPATTFPSSVDISLCCVLSAILSPLFHLLLISVCAVCYQPSCHNFSISCWYQSVLCVISHPVTTFPSPIDISLCCVLSAILSPLFHLLLISVCAMCYQPSCHNCFHIMIMLKFMVAKIFASAL